ncbi:hypothetical protein [Streptomyces atratus]|uniref:hypothetical protein n=1 Tax=Streptomyces atratus TaxID=1893 RepID=UPI0033DB8619
MNDQLPAQFTFSPGDPGYAEELAGFQTGFTLRPGLIVGATDADEVRAAVVFAGARGLPVSVQATGHGLAGAAEGGVRRGQVVEAAGGDSTTSGRGRGSPVWVSQYDPASLFGGVYEGE